jgi:hypothetical protein
MSLQNGSSHKEGFMVSQTESRAEVLVSFGANRDEVDELLHYNRNCFKFEGVAHSRFPLADELFVEEWETYVSAVEKAGSLTAIYPWLPQLQFAVQPMLRNHPEYVAAVRQGRFLYPEGIATGLNLEEPHRCQLFLHPTAAGRIPVIAAGSRADFITLIRAFAKKGEPEPVPDSMGAIIIGGYNNFHRIHRLRQTHFESGKTTAGWPEKFRNIQQQKHLFQDRFIILSPGPYSGVLAASLQLGDEEWEAMSLAIRLGHECTHYFTRRVFDSMQNNLLDELIADYCGLDNAAGIYPADWALHFLGVEDKLKYRSGGRLENYRGNPQLSSGAFHVLGRLVRAAVGNLAQLNAATASWRGTETYRVASIFTIAPFPLEDLARPRAWEYLVVRFHSWMASQRLYGGTGVG